MGGGHIFIKPQPTEVREDMFEPENCPMIIKQDVQQSWVLIQSVSQTNLR